MKVLIIDRDPTASALLSGQIAAAGHEVFERSVKNEGIEALEEHQIDAVYFDPAPLSDPRPLILQIRRMVHSYPYLILCSDTATQEDAIQTGCNEALQKPYDPNQVLETLKNAERMTDLVRRIGDESYDFPSSGGVISKSAFNQLFRSAIDRVSRYGELSHVLFINIPNYEDIKIDDGRYAADYAVSKLAQNLVRLRRQSDILAQTGVNEYAILLQRPQTETESTEAAKRFSTALDNQDDITSNGVTDLYIDVSLVHLPTGSSEFHRTSRIKGQGARSNG